MKLHQNGENMPRQKLIDGFNRFRNKHYENGTRLMEKLAREGAQPEFFIVNCIDPRNGADLVFDAEPGQQFIHSQMAAIIPPFNANIMPELNASLSYAADAKKIQHLIIMGHTQCGGVAALAGGTNDAYISTWVKMAEEAKQRAAKKLGAAADEKSLQAETERQIVMMSVENVLEYPMIKKAVADGRLTVNGWLFDLEKGALHQYQPETGSFAQISAPPQKKPRPPRQNPPKAA
jgi:carbonic anhydrase